MKRISKEKLKKDQRLKDDQEYGDEEYEGDLSSENDQRGNMKENEILSKEEKTR